MTAPAAQHARPRTGATITLVIGGILTITGPVLGILAGSIAMIPGALDLAAETAPVAPTATVTLDHDESVYLLAPVAELENIDHEMCAATGPDDTDALVSYAPASALNTIVRGTRYESFARVTAASTGAQEITCPATTGVPVVTAPPFSLGGLIGPLARWSIAGVVVSLAGVPMVIIGIIQLARTRGRTDCTNLPRQPAGAPAEHRQAVRPGHGTPAQE